MTIEINVIDDKHIEATIDGEVVIDRTEEYRLDRITIQDLLDCGE